MLPFTLSLIWRAFPLKEIFIIILIFQEFCKAREKKWNTCLSNLADYEIHVCMQCVCMYVQVYSSYSMLLGLQLLQYRFTAHTVQVYSSDSTQQTTCIVRLTSLSQILQTNFYLFQKINWFALNNFFLLKIICDVIYTSIQQELVVIEALENFAKKISGMGIKVGVQYAVINYFFLNFHPMSLIVIFLHCLQMTTIQKYISRYMDWYLIIKRVARDKTVEIKPRYFCNMHFNCILILSCI